MAFEATKREWGELYAFFRLLADGYVYAGTPDVKRNEVQKLPVAMVQREEHDGTRRYILEDEATVRICGEKIDKQIPREDFAAVAELVFAAVKESRENDVMSPDGVEEFLDEVAIYDLEAKTDDRTDFYVAFYSIEAPLVGFCVRSRLGTMFPLLDGGRAANLKFEQTGVKFATPTVNKINAFGEELMVDNAEQGLAKACAATGAQITDYSAAPVFMDANAKCRHQWLIEFAVKPDSLEKFSKVLDTSLQEINSDYEAKRHKNLTLQPLEIIVARPNLFHDWLKEKGKLGGQHKVPRLSNTREYIEEMLSLNK